MRTFCLILFAALFNFAGIPAEAQQAQRPTWNIGSACTYQVVVEYEEGSRKDVTRTYIHHVIAADANNITITSASTTGTGSNTRIITPEGNVISQGISRWSPSYPTYNFPLQVGKQWSGTTKLTNTRNADSTTYQVRAAVVGYENISVKAGSMPVFKIEINADYETMNSIGVGRNKTTEVVWYAPSLERMVKSQYAVYDWNGMIWNKGQHELLGCEK